MFSGKSYRVERAESLLLRLSRAFTQTATKRENEIQFQSTKSTRISRLRLGVLYNLSVGLSFLCTESRARIFGNRLSLSLEFLNNGLGVSASLGFYHSPPLKLECISSRYVSYVTRYNLQLQYMILNCNLDKKSNDPSRLSPSGLALD